MKIDAVIFDVDGTLWDATDVVATGWTRAAEEGGVKGVTLTGEILKQQFGKQPDIIMKNLFPDADQETRDKISDLTCVYEDKVLMEYEGESLLYPGVTEVFEELSKKCKVCVVSNCQTGYIEVFLKKNNLEKYVTDTECYGDTLKSKGENIKLVMERNNFKTAIYVGDTPGDFEATKVAGIPFVFVTYGFDKVEGAWKEIDDIREVLEMV